MTHTNKMKWKYIRHIYGLPALTVDALLRESEWDLQKSINLALDKNIINIDQISSAWSFEKFLSRW